MAAVVSSKNYTQDVPFFMVWSMAMISLLAWMVKPHKFSVANDKIGRVVEQNGTVEVRPPGEFMWYPATQDSSLQSNEVIATGPGSQVVVELTGGVQIQLPEKTQVKLLPIRADQGAALVLLNGSLNILPSMGPSMGKELRKKGTNQLQIKTVQHTLRVTDASSPIAIKNGVQIQTASPEFIVVESSQRSQKLGGPLNDETTAPSPKVSPGGAAASPTQVSGKMAQFDLMTESGLYLSGGELNLVKAVKETPSAHDPSLNIAMALGVLRGVTLAQETAVLEATKKSTGESAPKLAFQPERKALLSALENQLKQSPSQVKDLPRLEKTEPLDKLKKTQATIDKRDPKQTQSKLLPPAVFPSVIPGEKSYWTRGPISRSLEGSWMIDLVAASLTPVVAAPWEVFLEITEETTGQSINRPLKIGPKGAVLEHSWFKAFRQTASEQIRLKVGTGIQGPESQPKIMGSNFIKFNIRTLLTKAPSTLYLDQWSPYGAGKESEPWPARRPEGDVRPIHIFRPDVMVVLSKYLDGVALTLKPLQQKPGPFLIYGVRQSEIVVAATAKDQGFFVQNFAKLGLDLVFAGEAQWFLGKTSTADLKTFLDKREDIFYVRRRQVFRLDKELFKTHQAAVDFIKKFNPYFFSRKVQIFKEK